MKTNHILKGLLLACGMLSSLCLATSVHAGVFASMTMDGDFSDWNAVPAAFTDSDNGFANDIGAVYMANDDNFLYIRVDFYRATNPNGDGKSLYLGFDNDSNPLTGFNVYSLGVVGTEAAFQNDFPFEQATGTFNTEATPSANAPAGIAPYFSVTTSQEIRIARSALIDTGNNQLIFPNSSFNFIAYFDDGGNNDATSAIPYTFASVPEPGAAGLLGLGALALLMRRRRQVSIA